MLKTILKTKNLIFIAVFAILAIPAISLAGSTGSYDSGSWDGGDSWGSWGGNSPTYSYSYTPNYSYSSSYTPSYTGSSYSYPSYSSSYVPSYGSSYSYPSSNYGYSYPSYSSSYIPSSSGGSNSSSNSSASASASTTNNNINNNVNNVYVYTTPSGNAVVYNPTHVSLTGYCSITPTNPRLGQTVVATAYASGGVGDYTYTWGGDLNYSSSGPTTSFTSYSGGTKNITITIRSGQEVITRNCSVTFDNSNYVASYSSSITSGTPVSGIYTQRLTSGTPVSGIYLNDLPSTGLSLNWIHYMVMTMILILAAVTAFVYQARKRLLLEENI